MTNMSVMKMTPAVETPCTQHEEQIQENSREIAELKARANYKDKRINELIEDNKRIESKIDNLTDTVNKVMLNSIKDDNNLNQRVTTLETAIDTQDQVLQQYKADAKRHRDDERARTNQYLSYITVGVCVLTFVLTYLFK